MVHMTNIEQKGNKVFFDGYVNGNKNNHFKCEVDLLNSKNYKATIENHGEVDEAVIKIFYTLAEKGKLPKELTAWSY